MLLSRSKVSLFSLFAILCLVLAACAPAGEVVGESTSSDEAAAPASADSDSDGDMEEMDVIRIGALAPLSAPGAVVGGEAMRVAMQIAEADINEAGGLLGRSVEVIIEERAHLVGQLFLTSSEFFWVAQRVVSICTDQ